MSLKEITAQILTKVLVECKKEENFDRIKSEIIDPLIEYTFTKLYPYILTTSIIFFLTFILALTILMILVKINMFNNN